MWSLVPSGGSLPESVWRARHRFLIGLTFFHVVIIALAGPVLGKHWDLSFRALLDDDSALHVLGEALVVALFGVLACWRRAGRTLQATFVGFGLMSASAILVHLSGGYIELHFHFFVMLTFLALCQDWIPYLLAVAFVAVHHGVVGVLWPQSVYNHEAAFNAPWTWAGIHALFVLWSCVGSVVAWRFNEQAFAQTALILQAAGEGIFGVDTEAQITFINPAAATILGIDPRSVIGKRIGQVVNHLATDGTRLPDEDSPILAPLKDREAHQATDQIFGRMDGSYVPVDYVSTPMLERDQLTGVVVSFNDITARHRPDAAALEESLGQGIAIRIDTRVDDVPRFPGDAAGIREMLANLIFNAVDAMPKGGTITVRARSEGACVRLEVSDTGIGMSDEVRQRCLEPFFTTKGQHGTGLGLSLVHTTIQRHGGTLTGERPTGPGQPGCPAPPGPG